MSPSQCTEASKLKANPLVHDKNFLKLLKNEGTVKRFQVMQKKGGVDLVVA